jgi:ADP-ribose pyrophosphatase YjhB (NUDIX family)
MHEKDSYCSWCGRAFLADQAWPRRCGGCDNFTYRNPIPVAVVLVPVDEGLLVIRRGIEPAKGKLALPGGYVDLAETWQEAGAREVFEETGLRIDPAGIEDFRTRSAPPGVGVVVIFGLARPLKASDLPTFAPTDETTERLVLTGPAELAYQLHTDVVAAYFAGRKAGR